MAEPQMRADMEALMARLIQADHGLQDTRLQISAAPKEASLVGLGTIGKAPTLRGEHIDWLEWSFQLPAYMGSQRTQLLKRSTLLRRVRAKERVKRVSGPKFLPRGLSGRAHRSDRTWRAIASRGRSLRKQEEPLKSPRRKAKAKGKV